MLPRFFMSGLYPCFFEFDFQVLARRHEFGADPEDIAVVRHEPAIGEENTVAHRMHRRPASVAQGRGYVLPRKLLTRITPTFPGATPAIERSVGTKSICAVRDRQARPTGGFAARAAGAKRSA